MVALTPQPQPHRRYSALDAVFILTIRPSTGMGESTRGPQPVRGGRVFPTTQGVGTDQGALMHQIRRATRGEDIRIDLSFEPGRNRRGPLLERDQMPFEVYWSASCSVAPF